MKAVHVMPNDDKHTASVDCPCRPIEDDQTRRAIAQGVETARVFVHRELS
jgi:hypothetical protein